MKQAHSKVFSGTTNIDKPLNIKATKTSKTSSYQQIVALVKKAESEKAPFVRMADRYSVFFTLAALTISGGAWLMTGDPTRALTVLVVATPCPLILATPIAFTAGISDAAKKGIIFKTGGVMETLAEPDVFIFDKTGTLTLGKPQIINIELNADDTNISKKDVLEIVASVEQLSTHILAKTFVEAAKEQKIKLRVPNEMQEHLGFGVKASFGEDVYYIGKPDFLNDEGVKVAKTLVERYSASRQQGEMMVFLANKKSVLAVFTLRDEPRENIKETLDYVKKISKQLVMLTGDKQEVAEDIAKRFEIEDFQAECLPEEKLARVKKCQDTGKKVIMIGDGVNDAPALASADVGIAIGTLGSNASTDASDVVITVPDITRIQSAISISKRVVYIARQGIFIGIGLSIGLMFLGSFGLFVPVAGALFQEVIDVIVILNALRVKRI